MKRCLFTYELLKDGEVNYSKKGLKTLSKKITQLDVFRYDQDEQIEIAQRMVKKISIQGVQAKFSVVLSEKDHSFKEVETNGNYILKPQVRDYPYIPENEDLTMHLVSMAGIKVPWHGLLKCSDNSLSYVIKRFDRVGKDKVPMEDFSQLIGASRDTKYDIPMEKIAEAIEDFCTYPTLEYFKLFQRTILAFLLGNEDFHLKNIAVITASEKVQLSPIYDFVNTTIANPNSDEEMALSIAGKKKGLSRQDLIYVFGVETLFLPKAKVEKEVTRILKSIPAWSEMIDKSFLPDQYKRKYKSLIIERAKRLVD